MILEKETEQIIGNVVFDLRSLSVIKEDTINHTVFLQEHSLLFSSYLSQSSLSITNQILDTVTVQS